MLRSLNTAATGMVAQQLNLDVISNNLANVNTTAYKLQRAEFQDLMYQTVSAPGTASSTNVRQPSGIQYGLGSRNAAVSGDFSQGAAQSTNNPFDVMVMGDGFFRVQRPDGTTAYTRDGSFKRDQTGLLVNSSGYPLLPQMTIPSGAQSVTISEEGVVTAILPGQTAPSTIDTITIAIFPNAAGLTRAGQNLYTSNDSSGTETVVTPGQSGSGMLRSGYLEGSNVSVVEEMVKMITAQRAYEVNSKAIQTSDDMLGVLNSLKR